MWDPAGQLKPGMQVVFDGQTVADTWRGVPVDGPGTPRITLTSVPAYGTSHNLVGRVTHVVPRSFGVAVYIEVGAGWWSKPTAREPVTVIDCNGTWTTDITTGGTDQFATRIAAYLLPASVTPPLITGGALPADLSRQAAASVEVQRRR